MARIFFIFSELPNFSGFVLSNPISSYFISFFLEGQEKSTTEIEVISFEFKLSLIYVITVMILRIETQLWATFLLGTHKVFQFGSDASILSGNLHEHNFFSH